MVFQRLSTVLEDFSFSGVVKWQQLLLSLLYFVLGLIILRIAARLFSRHLLRNFRDQSREMIRKIFIYTGVLFLVVASLRASGVEITGLLGAAGVVGIAVGIASQASLSNIISGLFLVSERFFEIGDVVRVNGHTGTINAIDLLSIKIKTFDNLLVRIPNQQIIETDFINITKFPVRRFDYHLTIPFEIPIQTVFEALAEAVSRVPNALAQPEPLTLYNGHEGDGWKVLLGVWFERSDYIGVRNSVAIEIQNVFRERGLAIAGNYLRVSIDESYSFDSRPAST